MKDILSLYFHVPFCQRRCPYCAFYSIESAGDEEIAGYPRLLLEELNLRKEYWRGFNLGSIYIGGGTPTLLGISAISEILNVVKDEFLTIPDIEITLECNPGTVIKTDIEGYVRAGVNRLSIGIQSFNDEKLRFLGRIHDRGQAIQVLETAGSIPELKVSVDLMVGTPLDTEENWGKELDQLFEFTPDGVSIYSLTIEEGTALAKRADNQEKVTLSSDETVDLLTYISGSLKKAGYIHYEVSNWALPESESWHNLHYWKRGRYLGLGPSAHSFDGKHRTWNTPDMNGYVKAVQAGNLPPSGSEILSEEEVRSEWVYLALRLNDGLDFAEYRELFGEIPGYWKLMFEKIASAGLGTFEGERFRPNDRGLLLADEISARILG